MPQYLMPVLFMLTDAPKPRPKHSPAYALSDIASIRICGKQQNSWHISSIKVFNIFSAEFLEAGFSAFPVPGQQLATRFVAALLSLYN